MWLQGEEGRELPEAVLGGLLFPGTVREPGQPRAVRGPLWFNHREWMLRGLGGGGEGREPGEKG